MSVSSSDFEKRERLDTFRATEVSRVKARLGSESIVVIATVNSSLKLGIRESPFLVTLVLVESLVGEANEDIVVTELQKRWWW